MVLTMWSVRSSSDEEDMRAIYDGHPTLFSLRLHHGGEFSKFPGRQYVNGTHAFVDFVDTDEFSVHELDAMMLQLGYNGDRVMYYHFKNPESDLDVGLFALGNDSDVCKLAKFVPQHRVLDVYIELDRTKVNTYYESPQGNKVIIEEILDDGTPEYYKLRPSTSGKVKPSCGKRLELEWLPNELREFGSSSGIQLVDEVHRRRSHEEDDIFNGDDDLVFNGEDDGVFNGENEEDGDDSEDSAFSLDEEDLLHDVEVDMNHFHLNIDKEVEWVEQNTTAVDITDGEEDDVEVLDNDDFESLSEDEDGIDNVRKRKLRALRKKHKKDTPVGSGTQFYVGQAFHTAKEVKDSIKKYSVESRREIYFDKNDKIRIKAVCDGTIPDLSSSDFSGSSKASGLKGKEVKRKSRSCPWVLYVSRWREEDNWVVKSLNDNHSCLQSRKIKACTTTYLSKQICDQIESNPNIPLKSLQDQMEKKLEVGVSRMKIFRAKMKALNQVRGDYKMQYALLRDYILELQARNEDTTVKIDVESEPNLSNMETRVFKRIYVCLGSLKKGFKAGKRDLLGLDGTFMKGPYPGHILTAVGVDPNNGIYPVAYAIVETKNTNSWSWFLSCLGDDLDLCQNSNFTFVSDRQKGVIPAIAKIFPCAEHRFCLRHIYENMRVNWKDKQYKEHLWRCATACTVPHFNSAMEELKRFNKDAYEWLKKIPPHHWSRSHFSGRAHCDVFLNNMCESLNSKLDKGRDKPIITCLEFIREYLMKRIAIVEKEIKKCKGPLTPYGTMLLDANKKEATKYNVVFNGGQKYQVTDYMHDQVVVDMKEKYCSCRKWEVTGMPCRHAVATIWDLGKNKAGDGNPEHWTHPVYWLDTWKNMYEFKVDPINGRSMWPKSQCPTMLLPPIHHNQVGRPKKKRKKGVAEMVRNYDGEDMVKNGKLSRKGKSVKCTKCNNVGHNSRTCTGQPGNLTSGSSSGTRKKAGGGSKQVSGKKAGGGSKQVSGKKA